MKFNISSCLIAVAAFAAGIAVDRVVFSPVEDTAAAEGARVRNKESSSLSSRGSRSRAISSQPGRGDSDRQREESREEGADGVLGSFRDAMEKLQDGGSMDAKTASQLLQSFPPGRERRHMLEHLANVWGRRNGQVAIEWAESLDGSDRRRALHSALHGWSEEDPAGAAQYVAELPTSEQNLHLVHEMAHRWAESDRTAAMEWGASQGDAAIRSRAMGGVVSSWAETDPAAAANFASTIENLFVKHQALEIAARRWASQDTASAMEWAQGLVGEDRHRATRSILRGVAENTPGKAATIYGELTAGLSPQVRATNEHRRMAQEIASAWSAASPQEAADWAMGLPEPGEVRRAAVGEVAERWLRIDSMAAGEWILELPEGRVRDAAAERVVGTMLPTDPAAAFDWANSLSDDGHRTGMMREVLHRWSSRDFASANAALQSAEVSPEQRRELNQVFGRNEAPAPAEDPGGQSE